MAPLEAMSLKCLVVYSNAAATPEVLDNAAKFFDPDSSTSLATSIEKIVRNKRRKNGLIAPGLERIELFS